MMNPTTNEPPHALAHTNDAVTHNQTKMSAHVYQRRSNRADRISSELIQHPLRHKEDFPGQLCLARLEKAHIISNLDKSTFYPMRFNDTSSTRAHVARDIVPFGAIASAWLAAWIWLGGQFPTSIDITSTNHYHNILFGRNVRSTSRQIHSSCLAQFPHLLVTSPQRTACDIACSDIRRANPIIIEHTIHRLALSYAFAEHDCMEIMRHNTRQPRYTCGVNLLIHAFATLEDNIEQCEALCSNES
ncbi:hypothetical protein ACFQY8_02655 [Alloscardovia venturai]|uniref:Uncharacterized protein n=1 Tax=Alloscardovia venturai TaxID=1769421 RepID=A0ABW2Y5M4_9BIFI